jgi:acyl carrier protein
MSREGPADHGTVEELRRLLGSIAPDADTSALPIEADIRRALDIDSMDFLRFVIAIAKRFGVSVPESDYAQLSSLARAAAYVRGRSAPG